MKTNSFLFASILAGAMLTTIVGCSSTEQESSQAKMHEGEMAHEARMTHEGEPGAYPQSGNTNNVSGTPNLPGQDAFGAIQEIISILEADPATDWSRVDISALRSHLADMNRLVMNTEVFERTIDGGLEMTVTGQGSALQAIQAMAPAHAPMIDGLNGWTAKAELTADGAILTVTGADAKAADHIRGLGFYGLMASGSHHQIHHLSLARGESMHEG